MLIVMFGKHWREFIGHREEKQISLFMKISNIFKENEWKLCVFKNSAVIQNNF